MNYDYPQTSFSKCVMAGLATGIIATIINLIYNFIYRDFTKLSLSVSVINVSTIIFITIILAVIGGLVYYSIVYYFHKKPIFFVGLFIVLTIISIVLASGFQRSDDQHISRQFEGLYIGVLIITGLCISFIIPWLTKHKNAFFNIE